MDICLSHLLHLLSSERPIAVTPFLGTRLVLDPEFEGFVIAGSRAEADYISRGERNPGRVPVITRDRFRLHGSGRPGPAVVLGHRTVGRPGTSINRLLCARAETRGDVRILSGGSFAPDDAWPVLNAVGKARAALGTRFQYSRYYLDWKQYGRKEYATSIRPAKVPEVLGKLRDHTIHGTSAL